MARREPFITGSHAYGAPTADSDIDLVVFVPSEVRELLVKNSDDKKYPVRYGKLNLILARSLADFKVWEDGTRKLQNLGTAVTKEFAAKVFEKMREEAGVDEGDFSG